MELLWTMPKQALFRPNLVPIRIALRSLAALDLFEMECGQSGSIATALGRVRQA